MPDSLTHSEMIVILLFKVLGNYYFMQIQEVHFCAAGTTDLVFTNQEWQFCKLVEHLDHAFLHG